MEVPLKGEEYLFLRWDKEGKLVEGKGNFYNNFLRHRDYLSKSGRNEEEKILEEFISWVVVILSQKKEALANEAQSNTWSASEKSFQVLNRHKEDVWFMFNASREATEKFTKTEFRLINKNTILPDIILYSLQLGAVRCY